jgi:hypothetical protein
VFRTLCALALTCGAARADELKIGEPFKGELTKHTTVDRWPGVANPPAGPGLSLPVRLKSGHKYTFTAEVKGEGRKVWLAVLNAEGQTVKASHYLACPREVTVTYEEASTTGTFRVVVLSDMTGDFALRTTGPSATEVTAKALEDDIAELKALLAKKEAALKELKAKKP